MKILLANTAGFCFGVKRAVEIVDGLLAQGLKVCTLGPLIHNKQVINKLKKSGVIIVQSAKDVPKGYVTVIRSHGVPKNVTDNLKKFGIKYIDTTCPFVKRIHKIIKKESNLDKIVLIAGDKNHPEVKAILGYCTGKSIVFKDAKELNEICKSHINSRFWDIILVAQTTFDIAEWRKCVNLTKNLFTNPIIYDTICNTTQLRQKEAEKLSKKSDAMLVIGDNNSSNTNKLYNICKKYCKTVLVESLRDLKLDDFKNCECVGITAGASTPEEIIEEVNGAMMEHYEEESFAELFEASLKESQKGRKVKGTVVSVSQGEVCVDVGMKQAGIIPRHEMTNVASERLEDIVKVGDELDLLIIHVNDQEGTVTLSKLKADYENHWAELTEAYEAKLTLKGTVVKILKNGLLANYKCFTVFIPSSHVGGNKSIPFEAYLNKEVEFRIIELNKFKKRIVGSIKEAKNAVKEDRIKNFWDNIEVGKTYKGIVKSMTSYAVFVELEGCVDAIVHISELTWDRGEKPEDIVKLGQEIEARVKSFDKERGRVSLSCKNEEDSPWERVKRDFPIGKIFDAKIVSIVPFGAFARLIPGVDGLIHISKMADHRIESPREVVSEGDLVRVQVESMDNERKRVGLTMKFDRTETPVVSD